MRDGPEAGPVVADRGPAVDRLPFGDGVDMRYSCADFSQSPAEIPMALRTLLLLSLVGCSEYELVKGSEPEPEAEDLVDTAMVLDPATPPVEVLDTFDLTEAAGVDMLFFGDTSGSMSEELITMGEKITEVVASVSITTEDWQLLAVTGPSGCGVGGVLTPDTPDYANLFAAGLLTPPGEDLVDEWGLYNAATAVDMTDEGECNAGFMRADARLYIIFISDEDDNSPGFDTGDPNYWQTYTNAIVAKKGDPDDVIFSGVIGPIPDGCTGAEPGTGYAEAVEASRGTLLSICEDWYTHVAELVDVAREQAVFALSQAPDTDTLIVSVNHSERTEGWTYQADINSIVFTEEIPSTGDLVEVYYEVAE